MAFNKDRSRVAGMNLRQQMKRGAKRAKGGGGGGGAPFYVNKYVPPDTGTPDVIRLIPSEIVTPRIDFDAKDFMVDADGNQVTDVLPYFKWIEYYHATYEKSCVGSEGPLGDFKNKGDPCLAADHFWWQWRERQRTGEKTPNAMSRREKFAITVLVEAPFYKVPRTDKQSGAVIYKEGTQEPYYDWKKGSKRGQDEYALAGYERKEGHRQHWSLGTGHWLTLCEYGDSLGVHCRSCGTRDCIEEIALICQGCGDAVVEMASTSLSDEELQRMRDEEVRCPHCRHVGYLTDMIACTNCNHGERATLFDFDLEVKRVKTTTKEGGNQTNLQILSAKGPKPIDAVYGEDMRKPLDLPKIFSPTSIEKQRELFGDVPEEEAAEELPPRTPQQ